MPNIGIRVDGNSIIGTGHVMRCLAIAEELAVKGNKVYFIMADDSAVNKIDTNRYECVLLNTVWDDMESETELLISKIADLSLSLLLIDSYRVTDNYLKTVRRYVKTAYIDDLYSFDYSVDMLINYSAYADVKRYSTLTNTKYLIGTSYAPLRKQFRDSIEAPLEKSGRILILSGGTDPFDVISDLPKKLIGEEALKKYSFTVIKGSFLKNIENLENDRIKICENVTDMATLMKNVDFAVSAGGVTLYELCASKVPTVTYSFVDNQLGNVNAFDKLNLMPYAGDLRSGKEAVFDNIAKLLINITKESQSERKDRMLKFVDGLGTVRIAKEICDYINE